MGRVLRGDKDNDGKTILRGNWTKKIIEDFSAKEYQLSERHEW